MPAFFSLVGDGAPSSNPNQNPQQDHPTTCPENSFLLRNEENQFKGLESWQNNNSNNAMPNMLHNVNAYRFPFPMMGSCQDCGNQAKKDCTHMRTCCKSRGFQCNTHVKSTWVPAVKRRKMQQLLEFSDVKRRRESDGTASGTKECYVNVTGFKSGKVPPEVKLLALFRRVRVRSIDDTGEQVAYQTTVTIGGNVFKGILYDQGLRSQYTAGEASTENLK